MAFFRIYVALILTGYVLYYLGMLAHDFLAGLRKGGDACAGNAEEAVDISEEMKLFEPVMIVRKTVPGKRETDRDHPAPDALLAGGIEIDRLRPTLEQAVAENRDVGFLVSAWDSHAGHAQPLK